MTTRSKIVSVGLATFVCIGLTFALLTSTKKKASSCGPFFDYAVYSFVLHPDDLASYAKGNLGIVQPTYARSYLAVAYRNIIGKPLATEEQQAALRLWNRRITPYWRDSELDSAQRQWLAIRNKVFSNDSLQYISDERLIDSNYYITYPNLMAGAFFNAAATLRDLVAKYGIGSVEARDWSQTQDIVFDNRVGSHIPEVASSDKPQVVRENREYQVASAQFYSEHFAEARTTFQHIADNAHSPWRALAKYLVIRTYIRQALVGEPDDSATVNATQDSLLSLALKEIDRVKADPAAQQYHDAAEQLRGFIEAKLHPVERTNAVAERVLRGGEGTQFYTALGDYTSLLDHFLPNEYLGDPKTTVPEKLLQSDLTDWIITYQGDDSISRFDHALSKWRAGHQSHWLLAALRWADAAAVVPQEVLEAAKNMDHTLPIFPSIAYYDAKYLQNHGQRAAALPMIDAALAISGLARSAVNDFKQLKLAQATTLDLFLQLAQKNPAGVTSDDDPYEGADQSLPASMVGSSPVDSMHRTDPYAVASFDNVSGALIDQYFPLSTLLAASQSKELAEHLRGDLAMTGWTRAILIEDMANARAFAQQIQTLRPALSEEMKRFLASASPIDARENALWTLLHFPGLRPYLNTGLGRTEGLETIDSYRDNWWCNFNDQISRYRYGSFRNEEEAGISATLPGPAFLSSAELAQNRKEMQQLQEVWTAPNYLNQMVINWAQDRPNDERLPEALHLAVRASRYGCTDSLTGKYSKAAFDLLHKKFPKSSWTKKTPYYYN